MTFLLELILQYIEENQLESLFLKYFFLVYLIK